MTAHHDLDRQLNAFLLDGPTSLPDSSFDAVRDRTEQTRQRVVLGPWRVPTLNKLVPDRPRRRRRDRRPSPWFPVHRFAELECGRTGQRAAGVGSALRGAGIGGAGIGGAVARIPSAADRELHLAAAWDLRVLPRGMDRSSGDRALDGWPGPHSLVTPMPTSCRTRP